MIVFILAILNAMIIENIILSRFLGICPFLGVSNATKNAFRMGLAVMFVIIISTIITYPLYHFILKKANITYMDTICFILVIASVVQFIEIIIKKYSKSLYNALGIYLPLITTNCAVLGVCQTNTNEELNFISSLANAIGVSLGFLIVIVLFSFIRVRINCYKGLKCMKGAPIALITAAIMGIAFMGLAGMING